MAKHLTLEGGGQLEITEEGGFVRFRAYRQPDEKGLYKVWVYGKQGEQLLGTLIPEGGQLILERTVSREGLRQAGCWPVLGGKSVMSFNFTDAMLYDPAPLWHWEHRPFSRLKDPVLAESAAAWGSMLVREGPDGFQLAVPADPHHPFPLLPLFCLASIQSVDGQLHVVFSFLPSGEPAFPDGT